MAHKHSWETDYQVFGWVKCECGESARAEILLATLQSELAAARAELERARKALIGEWREKGSFSHGLTVAAEIASGKYNREIAHKGEEEG
jgi:hypothetical protein